MNPDFVPPYVAEAQRRYQEMLDNMEALNQSVIRLLAIPKDEFRAWLNGKGEHERQAILVGLYTLAAVPPPTYDTFLFDELNRRHGLYARTDTVQKGVS